jgi:hypothetical protein
LSFEDGVILNKCYRILKKRYDLSLYSLKELNFSFALRVYPDGDSRVPARQDAGNAGKLLSPAGSFNGPLTINGRNHGELKESELP